MGTFWRVLIAAAAACGSIHAANWSVNSNAGTVTGSTTSRTGTLPFCILNAASGDTIDCTPIAGQLITLSMSLPAITQNLTITGGTGSPVTIMGNSTSYQGFSVGVGTAVSITNFVLEDCVSLGGVGGAGAAAGGGGAGGGGGLYVHNGVTCSINSLNFMTNKAIGGAGGAGGGTNGGGGGGGGFGGGAGGAGSTMTGGGGGGGNSSGGAGGSGAAGTQGTFFGGGGGGSGGNTVVGFSGGGAVNQGGASSNKYAGGTSTVVNGGGGGGAGAGAPGATATTTAGAPGGTGIGADTYFGGGGGGGGGNMGVGGAGTGSGGGGGSTTGAGGAGGTVGGGGGGGVSASGGGVGGFGGGGGGSASGSGGSSTFGGGSGGTGATAGGGGGAGLGGGIFIANAGILNIGDGMTNFTGSNTASGGTSGGGGANTGQGLGQDIFMKSGGTMAFNLMTSNLTISSAIYSDQSAAVTNGGLTLQGTKTLTLSGANLYTGATTITSGTLSITSDGALGVPANGLTIQAGTLQINSGGPLTSARAITLTGAATLDTLTNPVSLSGMISGAGSITITDSNKVGSTVTLSGTSNSYAGGTSLIYGTLAVSNGSALGTGTVTLSTGTTLQTTAPITLANPISLAGPTTINSGGNASTFSGAITGAITTAISGMGAFTVSGGSIITLTGSNHYSGGTAVSSPTTLIGDTSSLQGNITVASGAALVFNQTRNGTYSGVLSGAGNLYAQGAGVLQFTGQSPGFTGSINVASPINLQVTGSLANSSLLSIANGATLSGSGTVGPVTSSGMINPGDNGVGTLSVNGNLILNANSQLNISVLTTQSTNTLQVSGTAILGGTVVFNVQTGFLGFGFSYPFVTSIGLGGTTFASYSFSNPNYPGTVSYTADNAVLTVSITEPFLNFPFGTDNEARVGNYIDDLSLAGVITPAVVNLVNSLAGFNNSQINNALDQMHPAQYSALIGGLQPQVGGQLLSLFHRMPYLPCGEAKDSRAWAVPFGNWLTEGNIGEQTGYNARTWGLAVGYDQALGAHWIIGGAGTWNQSDLVWQRGRGDGSVNRYLAGFYSDFMSQCFYCGFSFYIGADTNNITRHIQFSTVDLSANGKFTALNTGGEFSAAYLFGSPYCLLYPYLNVDLFYFRGSEFSESGADGISLDVRHVTSTTMRNEAGFALQIQDANLNETVCVSPRFALGWSMELPIDRPAIRSNFTGEPFSFTVHGWNHTFQMLTIDVGVKITFFDFSISGEYYSEFAPSGKQDYWGQRCNLGLEYSW